MRHVRQMVIAGGMLLLLYGCTTTPTATSYDVVRLGDNDLSCDEMYTEITSLQADKSVDTDPRTQVAKEGTTNTVMWTGLALAPFTAGLSLLGTAGAYAYGKSDDDKYVDASKKHQRAMHVTELYNEKHCKVPATHTSQR